MKKPDVRKITLSSMLLALLIVSAFISIPIPFLAIKITLQTMVIFLLGALFSPFYSFVTVFLYITLGLFGLPVFSTGGGITYVFLPSFGFLLGFLFAAPLMSYINGLSFSTRIVRYVLSSSAAILVMYLVGLPYLYFIIKLYMGKDISLTFVIVSYGLTFLPFDILKAALIYPIVRNRHIRRLASPKNK